MRNKRSWGLLIVLLLFGALAGGLLGEFLSQFSYFTWMSFGGTNGYKELFAFSLNPALDFRIVRFGFDFALKINAGSIIGMILALLVYARL